MPEAGSKMKEVGTSSWDSHNTDATNTSLFTGLAGGYINPAGISKELGSTGSWWIGDVDAFIYIIKSSGMAFVEYSKDLDPVTPFWYREGNSVRCLRD
jgi:hypothetical protein